MSHSLELHIPRGLITNWCIDFMLSNQQIETMFTHAKECTKNVFKQCFQYKLCTYILPTNEYLKKYRVADSDLCEKCNEERDTILHRLWECQHIIPFLHPILADVKNWVDRQEDFSVEEFLFGIGAGGQEGLNLFLIECKLFLFYDYKVADSVKCNTDRFYHKVRKLILKEKHIARGKTGYERFVNKWSNFTPIYDFRGPDPTICS